MKETKIIKTNKNISLILRVILEKYINSSQI